MNTKYSIFISIKTQKTSKYIHKININPQKILLIRTDRIGDVVLTLPMVDALKTHYPKALIDMLVNKRVYELVDGYSGINKLISLDKVTAGEVWTICKREKYDLAITVHPRFSIALGLYLGRVKYRLGTGYRWYSFLFNIKHYQHRKEAVKHELEYNIDLLQGVGINAKYQQPYIEVKDNAIDTVSTKLKSININKDNFIVIHIPSLGSAKVWSDENFTKLLNLISDKIDINVILTGVESDKPQIDKVFAGVTKKDKIHTITDLNLKQLAALLKLAKLFVGNSTGPIHIAAAVGTYCIGLYSPVKVETAVRWGPYTNQKKIYQPVNNDDSRDVMNDIKPEEVFAFIKEHIIKNSK